MKTSHSKALSTLFSGEMACDLDKLDLTSQIKDAEHAGGAKGLSKQMDECDRREWEDNHYDVMKDLLVEKAKTCEPF